MGNTCTKKKETEDEKQKVGFDSIYYDEDGNMRVGVHGRERKGPKGEFAQVLALDKQVLDGKEGEEGTKAGEGKYCVIEAGWVSSWLAFVYYNDSSPAPGKIQNSKLLDHSGCPIEGIQLASDKKSGHYRLIREPVWDLYCKLYKDSGPKIWVDEEPYNEPEKWQVDEEWLQALYKKNNINPDDLKVRRPTGVLEEAEDTEEALLQQEEEAKEEAKGDEVDIFTD
mmetsp:Transcript_65645/g.181668  ORF Transcript_65645/g.181668 Transcript_65645/m.181668 type:complete len:225 (+) Transcript_65645:294-968(+)|eukprot:CAMPEP_0119493212 /NCGR_PEP_ID=MMETSP1344-20130328/17528_1 /TAXON_ID=236787 /ORGANISM="Florenciella parvula, Strain CCMP2471" /LENGTH=224 /DNA_ID=CAMNT_0007528619 /DNA_START=268 /DNA_END=942 /DNA_ORIENTATION=-